MFRLKKLTLSGFKSFYDATEIHFDGGITAIVGPNGCGKSNVVDAVRWVLGAQSSKNLRSVRMADLIFGGTSTRKPLPMAEASLTLHHAPGLLPEGEAAPGPEEPLVVTRRVARDGDTEYLLNGYRVRLQDVRAALQKAGVSNDAYAIIEQGKVEEILTAKPEDRRVVIEEAAGIGDFKAKKRQAELKLARAQENLSRVDDIVREITSRMRSLKIQAGRARSFREVESGLKELKRFLYGRRVLEFQGAYAEARKRWEALRDEDTERSTELTRLEAKVEALKAQARENQQRLDEMRDALSQSERSIDKLNFQVQHNEDKARQSKLDIEELSKKRGPLNERLEGRKKSAQNSREAFENFESDFTREESLLREKEEALALSQIEIDGLFEKTGVLEREVRAVEARLLETQSELTHGEATKARLLETRERLDGERQRLESERASLESETGEARSKRQDAREKLDTIRTRLTELRSENQSREGVVKEAEEQLKASDRKCQELELRIEHLKKDESQSREQLEEIQKRVPGTELLSDLLSVPEEKAAMVQAAWGGALDAYVVSDLQSLRELLSWARENQSAVWAVIRPEAGKAPAAGSLNEALAGDSPSLAGLFPEALECESLEAAWELSRSEPSKIFVTPSGEALFPGGRVRGGALRESRIVQKTRLEKYKSEHRELRETRDGARSRFEALQSELQTLSSNQKTVEGELPDLEKALLPLAAAHEQAQARLTSLTERLEALARESERHEADERSQKEREVHLREVKEILDTKKQAGEKVFLEKSSTLREKRATLETLREGTFTARASFAVLSDKKRTLESVRESAAEELRLADEALLENDERLKHHQAQVVESEKEILDKKGMLEGELQNCDKTKTGLHEALETRNQHDDVLREKENKVRSCHHDYENFKDVLSEADVRRTELSGRLEALREKCREDFPEQSAESLSESLSDEDREKNLEEADTAVAKAEDKIRRLGGNLNFAADEEYKEIEERNTFLTTQREDVIESIQSLQATVKELDENSSRRFQEAYETIRENFRTIFERLFEGGSGELLLVPEGDYLDGGLDIAVQPPGKKLQSLAPLSGGEKALAAIALLFAIFQYRSAPFCILDEVDAALDDANVERFNTLVRDMAEHTQVICITHNKRTMRVASSMYGVTMEEPGVSKVLSAKID